MTDFINVANDKQTLASLRALDDATIEEGYSKGRSYPVVFPRKMLGVLPPFLMKRFRNAGSPLQTLNGVISEIHKYASDQLGKKGAKAM